MSPRPSFLFIPGSWHTPAYFEDVIAKLADDGYGSQVVSLPSAGTQPAVESMGPDVAVITSKLSTMLKQGHNVIVVAHSYGGECGSAAVGKLVKHRAASQDSEGHISRMVYISAFVPIEGESHMAMMAAFPEPVGDSSYHFLNSPWVSMNDSALEVMCHDVSEPKRLEWKQMTRNHAAATLLTPVTDPAWKYIPTTYVYTTLDRAIFLRAQQWLVRRIKETGTQGFGEKAFDGSFGEFTIESGHMPFLSKADELAGVLVKIAHA